MKKKALFILPLIACLASCQTGASSSSSLSSSQAPSSQTPSSTTSSSSSSSSSTPAPVPEVLDTADKIFDYLIAASKGNYTFTSTYLEREYVNIFTENYYYSSIYYPYSGSVLLENIDADSDDENVLYAYEMDGEEILLGNPQTIRGEQGVEYATDINSVYNTLSLLNETDYSSDLLSENADGSFDLENDSSDQAKVTFLAILGYSIGYDTSLLGYVKGATLTGLENGSLEIQFNVLPIYESQIDSSEMYGVISDVGTSTYLPLENFIASDPLGGESLPDAATGNLKRASGSVTTDVKVTMVDPFSGEKISEPLGTFRVDYDEDHLFTSMTQNGISSLDNYYRGEEEGGIEKNAYSRKITGANELVLVDAGEGLDSIAGDRGASQVSAIQGQTRLNEDGSYTYHGLGADDYLVYLTGLAIADASYLTFHVSDGEIESITARYGQSTLEGIAYYFDIVITFGEAEDFVDPSPYVAEATTGDKAILSQAFERFNEEDSFCYTYYDLADKEADPSGYDRMEVYVSEDVVLQVDYHQGAVFYRGSRKVEEGKLVDFSLTKNSDGTYAAEATTPVYEGELMTDYAVTLDPLVLQLVGSNRKTAILRPNVLEVSDYIVSTSKTEYMDPSTFSMTLDAAGNIASYSYDYNMFGLLTGTEQIDFAYGEEGEIPSGVLSALDSMSSWTEPTDWSSCTSVYSLLVTLFGKETADSLPYLYYYGVSEELVGLGVAGNEEYPSTVDAAGFSSDGSGEDFIAKYTALLESEYADEYVKETLDDGTVQYVGEEVIIQPYCNPGEEETSFGILFTEVL